MILASLHGRLGQDPNVKLRGAAPLRRPSPRRGRTRSEG
jgi:hypothetical protein